MDVAASGDGRRVAERPRGLPDGLHDVPLRIAIGLAGLEGSEGAVGQHRPGPGPEVLGRHVLARDLPQVRVDVLRAHVAHRSRLVQVLEQLLARQVLAPADDPRQAPVTDGDLVLDAALAPEPEAHPGRGDRRVAVAQGG